MPDPCSQQAVIDHMEKMVSEIHAACVGNTDGTKKGYNLRLAMIESWQASASRWVWLFAGSFVSNLMALAFILFSKKSA